MNISFESKPVYGEDVKYIKAKIKIYAGSLIINFHNKKMLKEKARCHFMCFVSLVLDIRLNTLIFKSFTVSGTQIFGYGLLMLLQLPLHLFILMLKK